jgi:transposase
MPGRGPYQKTSTVIRQRVLSAWENGEDPYAVGIANGMKRRTICDLINRGTPELKQRGGKTPVKITEVMKRFLEGVIEEAPDKTLEEMSGELEQRFHVHVTAQAIGHVLDGLAYSVKKMRVEPQTMNNIENKQKRFNFCQSLVATINQGCRIIWMDETNFNIHCSRSNGRAKRGARAIVRGTTSKGPNIHIIGAMTATEILKFKTKRGAFKGPDFALWIKELLATIAPIPTRVVIVCDNAPVHSKAEDALTAAMTQQYGAHPPFQCEILRLAPYSPMLNAIESLWSTVKTRAKALLRVRRGEVLAGPPLNTTIISHRLTILEECVTQAMQEARQQRDNLAAYVQHLNPAIIRGLNLQDMLLGQ